MTNTYPKTLHHPGYDPGSPAQFKNTQGEILPAGMVAGTMFKEGTNCRFPPQIVTSAPEEELYRAKGYRGEGEAAPAVVGYNEYPKMLVHPDFVAEVPDEIHARKEEGKGVETFVVKGTPAKFPPVTANSLAEETAWNIKGYQMPVLADPGAFEKARAVPFGSGASGSEWPKMVNGVLTNDPSLNTSGRQEYPKYVGTVCVNSFAEEEALLGASAEYTAARIEGMILERRAASEKDDDATVAKIEKALLDHGIQIKDKPHGTVWTRIKAEEALAEADKHVDATPIPDPVPSDEAAERLTLIAEAAKRGVKIDKRWNNEKIMEALTAPSQVA